MTYFHVGRYSPLVNAILELYQASWIRSGKNIRARCLKRVHLGAEDCAERNSRSVMV